MRFLFYGCRYRFPHAEVSAGAERKNDVGKRGISQLNECSCSCMHGEDSPVAVETKTRRAFFFVYSVP